MKFNQNNVEIGWYERSLILLVIIFININAANIIINTKTQFIKFLYYINIICNQINT